MSSSLTREIFQDPLVAGDVPYAVLTPAGWTKDESLPLVIVLHGANSSCEFLALVQPIVDGMWDDGSLPRSVIACASTPTAGGFYIDHPGGDAWESLVTEAFPRMLAKEYGVDSTRVSLLGSSMGGYGVLKMAFAEPARWQAAAAIAPALLPALSPQDLRPRNTIDVLAQLGSEMADHDQYAENSVLHRAQSNAAAVRASGLAIFLRCGDRDMFAMHDGTEQLHRALFDLDIGHEYHLVHDADHLGPEAIASQRAALAFIGAAQRRQAGDDRTAADRDLEAAWREWAASGRQGRPPAFDAFGVTGPVAMRILLEPQLSEAARRDPTATRRYGVLPTD